ncbi:MAG: hypothetical protein ACRD41_07485 [Candidatus Acidiferrales bacterium]
MDHRLERKEVHAAAADLRRRTLSHMPRALDRLIYLASMRDYNSGAYHHAGLAAHFSEGAASEAIAGCHREAFRELLSTSLEELVAQLSAFAASSGVPAEDFLETWKTIEPFRVAVPADTDSLTAEFLCSNLRISLAIFESRLVAPSVSESGA